MFGISKHTRHTQQHDRANQGTVTRLPSACAFVRVQRHASAAANLKPECSVHRDP
jgi:hypothetical protein